VIELSEVAKRYGPGGLAALDGISLWVMVTAGEAVAAPGPQRAILSSLPA
jgi:hypothetical protein